MKAGLDGGSICERPLGLKSVGFVGEAGVGVLDVWIIDTGRELLTEDCLVAVVDVAMLVLLVLECAWLCGALILEERARPLGFACPWGNLVDEVLLSPISAGTLRGTALAVSFEPALAAPGPVEEALLSFDCVRVCDLVEGVRPSWLVPGTRVDNGLDVLLGGGMAFLSALIMPLRAVPTSLGPST